MAILRSKVASVLLLSVVVIVAIATYSTARADSVVDAGTVNAEAMYPFDVTDARQLTGDADNVFVGRVVEQVGSEDVDTSSGIPIPRTQFSVEVQENIKGHLSDVVTVSQDGGYVQYAADRDYPEAGVEQGEQVRQLVLMGNDPLLKSGEAYLFVTKHSEENGYHQISSAGYANERINDVVERENLVETYEKARAEQIDPTDVSANDSGELVHDNGELIADE